jgi:putative membrane protein insertion efficiency factor
MMKTPQLDVVFVLALVLLSGAANACQSCLLDLTFRGVFKGSSDDSAAKTKTNVAHASVLPIGLSSKNLLTHVAPYFNVVGIDSSTLGFLVLRKFITLQNDIELFGIKISRPQKLNHKQLKRVIFSQAEESENSEADTAEENSKVEEEVEVMSSSMIMAIGFYKQFISPLLPPACRFLPTCSQYGVQAIKEFGPTKGVILTAWRLARCSPLGGKGKIKYYSNFLTAVTAASDMIASILLRL